METTPPEPGDGAQPAPPDDPVEPEASRALAVPADLTVARALDRAVGGPPATMADAALGRTASGRVGGVGDLRDRGNGSGSAGETPTDADFGLLRRRSGTPAVGTGD
ncbi:MAG TPA: hypothetical protein VFW96_11195 [Thermomicrobiales bacterium]|nr:hypothetical protein [Thermomicrobiales bacterium]